MNSQQRNGFCSFVFSILRVSFSFERLIVRLVVDFDYGFLLLDLDFGNRK